jgi:hypothetical protein
MKLGMLRLNSWCRLLSGVSDGQAGFGEAVVDGVAAILDVSQAASDALKEVFRRGEGDVGEPALGPRWDAAGASTP